MTHPIDSVYVDSVSPNKSDIRSYIRDNTALRLVSEAEAATLDLQGQKSLVIDGLVWDLDSSDTTSAAAALEVIVSNDGFRFKPAANYHIQMMPIFIGDETTDLTVGTGKIEWRMPYAFKLTGIFASVTTAPTLASVIMDVNQNGTSIMTTNKLEIDAGLESTRFSTTQPALTTTALALNDTMSADIDQIGSGNAGKGAKIYLIGFPT